MPAVIARKENAVGLVVRGDDDAAAVEDRVDLRVFLVARQRFRR